VELRGGSTCRDAGWLPRGNNNPAPRSIRIFESVDEDRTSWRHVGLERDRLRRGDTTPWGPAAMASEKAIAVKDERGWQAARSRDRRSIAAARNLGEESPRRHRRGNLVNPGPTGGLRAAYLEPLMRRRAWHCKVKRAATARDPASERAHGAVCGSKPRRETPRAEAE